MREGIGVDIYVCVGEFISVLKLLGLFLTIHYCSPSNYVPLTVTGWV